MVSIVIPTYNHLEDCLIPCIESIKKYTDLSGVEIIVVANGCTDKTWDYICSEEAISHHIWVNNPVGFPKAVNLGIERSSGEYVVILNNDVVLLEQEKNTWLDILRKPFRDYRVGVTGPMMVSNVPGVDRKFLIFFCAMISREVIDKIGVLDEEFSPGFGEDCDFCWRAEDAGFKLVQVPDSSGYEPSANFRVGNFPIYHRGHVTFKDYGPETERSAIFSRNLLRLKEIYGGSQSVPDSPKIYDCFMFRDELELLDIRFHELNDVVDHFVLVECRESFTGKPQKLFYEENKSLFDKKFTDKVKHIILDSLPKGDTWYRENFQRSQILSGLEGCRDEDLVIISDADEIPSAESVRSYRPDMGIRTFPQTMYYYWLNCRVRGNDPNRVKICTYSDLIAFGVKEVRYRETPFLEVTNGGWHFSYMGGEQRISDKISSFAHSEYNRPEIKDLEHIYKCMNTPCDLFSRPGMEFRFVDLDESFPKFVLENKDKFSSWVKEFTPVVEVKDSSVTAYMSTKNRFDTTLPLAIRSVINQTMKPKKFVLFLDGEHLDLREHIVYRNLFRLLEHRGIDWEVEFSLGQGQVKNHIRMLEKTKSKYLWRLDDDNDAEPDVLEILYKTIKGEAGKIGAVGGCVVNPSRKMIDPIFASSKIEDVFLGWNPQWSLHTSKKIVPVDHLYSTFLFDWDAASHGYEKNLSVVGHREETIFTYKMVRNGWNLLFNPKVITWHYQEPKGGIRSHSNQDFWAKDEQIFLKHISDWGVKPTDHFIVVNENGLGDHCALRHAMNKNKDRLLGRKILAFTCTKGIITDGTEGSIAEALAFIGDLTRYNIYWWMEENRWTGKLWEAYQKMYFGR